MKTLSRSELNSAILNLLFALFLIGEFIFLVLNQAIWTIYFFNLIGIVVLFFVIFSRQNLRIKWKYSVSALTVLKIMVFALFAFLFSRDIRLTLLILKFILLYSLFSQFRISSNQFIGFINKTYIIYVIISAIFFYLIPNVLYQIIYHPQFYADYYFIKFPIFRGMQGGTPASIDSYSAIIFIINLFNKKNNPLRRRILALSIICILLSLRMTPLVALSLSLLAYPIIRKPLMSVMVLFLGFLLFLVFVVMLFNSPTLFGIDFYQFAYLATHARSMVWVQQITVLLENYSFIDYLFGNFSSEKFSVPAFQITGYEKDQLIDNPHNNYLLLFYQMPVPFILVYLGFLTKLGSNFNRKWFPAIMLLSIAGFTNSTIISLHNPIYIMIICFYLTNNFTSLEKK